jgi:HEAT repeat protein
MRDARALEPLVQLLECPDRPLAIIAARGLGRIGDARAVPHLLAVLGDGDTLVSRLPAFPGWREVLVHRPDLRLDEETALRQSALVSLAQLGAGEVLPTLHALLGHEDRYVRAWAASLLVPVGNKDTLRRLRALERQTPMHRRRKLWNARRRLERRLGRAHSNTLR